MPIVVDQRTPEDYTRKGGDKRWRASRREDFLSWLEPYFLPETPPIKKCPHGNGQGLDCTVCRPYDVPGDGRKPVPSKQVRIDLTGRPLYFLRRFHRTFDYRVEDHDVSPYDSHIRRSGVSEYEGGYFTAGYGDDGIGIRVQKKHGPTDEDFEMRWDEFYAGDDGQLSSLGDGTFGRFPAPDDCIKQFAIATPDQSLELFRFSISRATRVIPAAFCDPGPVVALFKDERGTERIVQWKPDKKFVFWKRTAPQVLRAWPSGVRWTYWICPPKGYFSSQPAPTPLPISIGAPWPFEPPTEYVDPPSEWKYRKYGPAVGRRLRTPHGWHITVRQFRKVWPEKWRTERKMRDISARLKMYDYGAEGLINVPRMRKTAHRNYYQVWKDRSRACGIVARQNFWPWGDRVPRGSTEARYGRMDTGQCVTVDKGDPLRRTREIERRRREIPEAHYQAWLSTGEITVYLDCVLPSGRPNVGVVEARKDG